MSPEVLAHALEEYLAGLRKQAKVAEAFFFGRFGEGMEGLAELPGEVRLRIDQLIWDTSCGEPIDLSEERSAPLVADAILFSLEERMGLHSG